MECEDEKDVVVDVYHFYKLDVHLYSGIKDTRGDLKPKDHKIGIITMEDQRNSA